MGRLSFSANLGFLWADLPLPDAIRAAAAAGFDAVECHWPYATDPAEVRAALVETGLPMLGLNTAPGDPDAGDFGLSAVPGRETEARAAIDAAIDYAAVTRAHAVHVMAGKARGPDARATFLDALAYAAHRARPLSIGILIEPLNRHDVPGYHIGTVAEALDVARALSGDGIRLMFDCYHVARAGGDILALYDRAKHVVGHVQIAGVPARGRPDEGEVDYASILAGLRAAGWLGPFGAEYLPQADTGDTLDWMATFEDENLIKTDI